MITSTASRRRLARAAAILAPALLLTLGGCATGFSADVARFQQMPPAQGQTFTIQSRDPRMQGGLEFRQYAGLVSQRLTALGYQPAAGDGTAQLVVDLDYGVDNGQEKVVTEPGFGYGAGWGYGPGWGWRGRYRGAWGWGWNDPFLFGGFGGPEVRSYRYYTSFIDMTITRASGERVFEGKAKARSLDDSLPRLVPNLIDAMFTGFPGRSGEEMRITIPPPKRG